MIPFTCPRCRTGLEVEPTSHGPPLCPVCNCLLEPAPVKGTGGILPADDWGIDLDGRPPATEGGRAHGA